MSEVWFAACNNTIQQFIERSTRLETGKLPVEAVEYIDFHYQIGLSVTFHVSRQQQEQAGGLRGTPQAPVYYHRHDYEQALRQESERVLERVETLQETRQFILAKPYGGLARDRAVYQHPVRICLTENCASCNGHGEVNCHSCSGSGKQTCHGCHGSGSVMRQRSYYDHYTKQNRYENYHESCSSCGSMGRVNCSSCRGSGRERCSPCQGSGKISWITTLETVARPDFQLIFPRQDVQEFIREGLYKVGLPHLASLGQVTLSEELLDPTARRLQFIYAAEAPFGRMKSQLLPAGTQINWILYGHTPQIFDAGHVLEVLLKSDLDALVRQAQPLRLINPLVAAFSRGTVHTFMESEAHQEMLEAHRRGKEGHLLREALNRAFAITYLDEALGSLKTLIKALQRWSQLKWALFATLAVYCLLPLMALWQQQVLILRHAPRNYLTLPVQLETQQQLLTGVQNLLTLYGWPVLGVALGGTLLGYIWRRCWLRWRLGKPLSQWSVEKKLLRSRWLSGTLLTVIMMLAVLLLFPVWISGDGKLFGELQLPLRDLLALMAQYR